MIQIYNRKTNKYDTEAVAGEKYINWAYESPIGKALLGAKKGSTVEVNAPAGVIKYQILSITK